MRKKKTVPNIKVYEDLAYHVNRMLDNIIVNKKDLGIENVWTMDVKVKLKFCGDDRIHLISYNQEFLTLMNRNNK